MLIKQLGKNSNFKKTTLLNIIPMMEYCDSLLNNQISGKILEKQLEEGMSEGRKVSSVWE